MKRSIFAIALVGILFNGCCNTTPKTDSIKEKVKEVQNKKDDITKKTDVVVEVPPVVGDKAKVVTKVKKDVKIIDVKKVDKNATPAIVIDPVPKDIPVKKVEVLPKVDDTVGVVTEVEPTVAVEEEIPVKDKPPVVVVDPVPAD
jgi:hypothetical protein